MNIEELDYNKQLKAKEFFEKLPNRIKFKYLTDNFVTDYDNAYSTIVDALNKQIPQKVTKTNLSFCPGCNSSLAHEVQYCNHCGQKLDW